MAAAGDVGVRTTFGSSTLSHWFARVFFGALGLILAVVAVLPLSWVEGSVASRVGGAAFGGLFFWLAARARTTPTFEVRSDGIEYREPLSGRSTLVPRQFIGLVTVRAHIREWPKIVVLDRVACLSSSTTVPSASGRHWSGRAASSVTRGRAVARPRRGGSGSVAPAVPVLSSSTRAPALMKRRPF